MGKEQFKHQHKQPEEQQRVEQYAENDMEKRAQRGKEHRK